MNGIGVLDNWIKLGLLLLLSALSPLTTAGPFVLVNQLEYQERPSAGSTEAEHQWQALASNRAIPASRPEYQLRGHIQLDQAHTQPVGLFVNLLGSFDVFWDGHLIGHNGTVGNTIEQEIPGNIDTVLLVPPHLATPGQHTVVIKVSRHRLSTGDLSPHADTTFAWIFVADYAHLLTMGLKRGIVPLLMSGATLLIFIYLSYLYISLSPSPRYLLFSGLFSLSLLLLMVTESWRGVFGYPYDWHLARLSLVTGLTLFSSVTLVQFILHFFHFSRRIHWLSNTLLIGLCAAVYALSSSSDLHSLVFILSGTVIGLCLSLMACYQNKSYSKPMVLVLGLFLTPVFFGGFDFTDRYFFISSGVLLGFVLYVQGRTLKYHQQQLAHSELRKTRLELELVKRNIQPHFILNTLTAVEEWIEAAPQQAILFIQALAQEFRQLAKLSQHPLIALRDEIALCRSHIAVMEYRTANQFELHGDFEDEHIAIPPGILLTLVENGISHFPKHHAQATFCICQRREQDLIVITFTSENQQGLNNEQGSSLGTGLGHRYIFARMNEAYHNQWQHTVQQTNNKWQFTLRFPAKDNTRTPA